MAKLVVVEDCNQCLHLGVKDQYLYNTSRGAWSEKRYACMHPIKIRNFGKDIPNDIPGCCPLEDAGEEGS